MARADWTIHLPRGADAAHLLDGGSLVEEWWRSFEAGPSRPCVHDPRRGWVTRAQLHADAERAAARLRAAGLHRGDRVIVSAEASADLVGAYIGALRAGLICVPANTAYREREIAHIVDDAQPRGAIVDDAERAGWIRAAAPGSVVVSPSVELPAGLALDDPLPIPDDPALLCYTSGTTGAPKGAVLSHANLLAGARSVVWAWRWTDADRLLLALPLFHMHGLGVGLHGTLLAGASAVLYPRFDADTMLRDVRGHEATMLFGVPTMYSRLAASDLAGELAHLRVCVSGSAALPPELFARVEAIAAQRIVERYGMTETLMNVSNPYDGERRPGTVGVPLPGVRMRIVDGEIRLKGPSVFSGYWQRPEATGEAFDEEGWFRTGDVGELDEAGYLRIVGRTKELIITGGYNVYPREVEDVLLEHPSVEDVAVVGTPDADWGEVVTAFVVGHVETSALLAHAAERLAPYKRPRIVRHVGELPRNALGKVLRDELRAR